MATFKNGWWFPDITSENVLYEPYEKYEDAKAAEDKALDERMTAAANAFKSDLEALQKTEGGTFLGIMFWNGPDFYTASPSNRAYVTGSKETLISAYVALNALFEEHDFHREGEPCPVLLDVEAQPTMQSYVGLIIGIVDSMRATAKLDDKRALCSELTVFRGMLSQVYKTAEIVDTLK